jgi:hypothetical protein
MLEKHAARGARGRQENREQGVGDFTKCKNAGMPKCTNAGLREGITESVLHSCISAFFAFLHFTGF